MSSPSQFPSHSLIAEPFLAFHPDRPEDKHRHPLVGLTEFGPFSQFFSNYIYSPVRIAVISPAGKIRQIRQLVNELDAQHSPRERKQYLIPFKGFSSTFQVRIAPAQESTHIELPAGLSSELNQSHSPHVILSEYLNKAISALQAKRTDFDVLFIYLPEEWSKAFYGNDDEDFDLHDFLKGLTATKSIPLQIVTENALNYSCRASVAWRLGIAVYCKAGGVPWRLADASANTAFIGLSYAVRSTPDGKPRFVTCCSQVFNADGAGLEFIAYDSNETHQDYENPYLSRTEMRRVMSRSLRLYQLRHGGRIPKNITIHKGFDFTPDEIEGCFDAWKAADGLHLLQIQTGSIWRGIDYSAPRAQQKSQPSAYPVQRGSYLPIDGRSTLLWTQGNAPSAVGGKNFFKEGKGIPKPLVVTRHAGHGSWHQDCQDILGLSKMNWNNDGLYDIQPVTLGYAEVLARTVKRIQDLAAKPYEVRYFI